MGAGFIHIGTITTVPRPTAAPRLARVVTLGGRMIFGLLPCPRADGDPRFRRVLWLGILLALALLVALLRGPPPADPVLVGERSRSLWSDLSRDRHASVGRIGAVHVGAVDLPDGAGRRCLLGPVPRRRRGSSRGAVLPVHADTPRIPFADAAISTVNFFGVLVLVNLGALMLVPFAGPFAPVLFWSVNGWLLGREYFTAVRCSGWTRTPCATCGGATA